jgi:hypothetical protein
MDALAPFTIDLSSCSPSPPRLVALAIVLHTPLFSSYSPSFLSVDTDIAFLSAPNRA